MKKKLLGEGVNNGKWARRLSRINFLVHSSNILTAYKQLPKPDWPILEKIPDITNSTGFTHRLIYSISNSVHPYLIHILYELHLTPQQIRTAEHVLPAITASIVALGTLYLWKKGGAPESLLTYLIVNRENESIRNKMRIVDSIMWHVQTLGATAIVVSATFANALHQVPWPKG